jgi:hypothetical protein
MKFLKIDFTYSKEPSSIITVQKPDDFQQRQLTQFIKECRRDKHEMLDQDMETANFYSNVKVMRADQGYSITETLKYISTNFEKHGYKLQLSKRFLTQLSNGIKNVFFLLKISGKITDNNLKQLQKMIVENKNEDRSKWIAEIRTRCGYQDEPEEYIMNELCSSEEGQALLASYLDGDLFEQFPISYFYAEFFDIIALFELIRTNKISCEGGREEFLRVFPDLRNYAPNTHASADHDEEKAQQPAMTMMQQHPARPAAQQRAGFDEDLAELNREYAASEALAARLQAEELGEPDGAEVQQYPAPRPAAHPANNAVKYEEESKESDEEMAMRLQAEETAAGQAAVHKNEKQWRAEEEAAMHVPGGHGSAQNNRKRQGNQAMQQTQTVQAPGGSSSQKPASQITQPVQQQPAKPSAPSASALFQPTPSKFQLTSSNEPIIAMNAFFNVHPFAWTEKFKPQHFNYDFFQKNYALIKQVVEYYHIRDKEVWSFNKASKKSAAIGLIHYLMTNEKSYLPLEKDNALYEKDSRLNKLYLQSPVVANKEGSEENIGSIFTV